MATQIEISVFLPTAAFQQAAVFAIRRISICIFAMMSICGYNGGREEWRYCKCFRRKAEKRMVELSPNEARMMREALLAFRNKLLSAGKPTEDVNELIIKVMK